MPHFHVRLTKDYLVFSAAHFITFSGNVCERLHGHNYRVQAEVRGPLDVNHYVVDFIALRDTLQQLVREWDHHVLLPTEHPQIRVTETPTEIVAVFEDRRWVFPRGDCVLLPVANTTAERLAELLAQRLARSPALAQLPADSSIKIEVDECEGQWGGIELRLGEITGSR